MPRKQAAPKRDVLKHKFIVTVSIETAGNMTKKDVRETVQLCLGQESGFATKVRVRTVDFD